MSGPQQFSLRWNNYSQHIVTAIEELRTDDEFTDVTLSCEGQRIKGHKMLLSACSSYFRETFKENPCKHPIIILKGVSFHDLEAVVQFMYNGQVNVSQDGLPSFLATAELLQIKGLTDMNDREDFPLSTKISNSVNKRMLAGILPQSHLQNQNSNSSLSHSASRSGTPDNVQQQRPPSPKRKRIIADNFDGGPSASSGAFASSSSSTPTQQPVMGSSGSNGPSASSSTAGNSGLTNQSPMLMSAVANAGTSLAGASQAEGSDPFNSNNVTIKYEEEGMQDEDDYDEKHNMSSEDNDNSIQDMMGHMEPGSLGSFMGGSGSGGLGTSGTDSSHADGGELPWDFEAVSGEVEEQQREREEFDPFNPPAPGTIVKDGKRYWRWTETRTFSSLSEAQETLRLEGDWTTAYKYDTSAGHKQYYRCKVSRKCPVLMYLMCHSNKASVTQFGNNEQHDAHGNVVPNRGMSDELKAIITQLVADGYRKPNQILVKLEEIGLAVQKDKIKTFLRTLRKAEELAGPNFS